MVMLSLRLIGRTSDSGPRLLPLLLLWLLVPPFLPLLGVRCSDHLSMSPAAVVGRDAGSQVLGITSLGSVNVLRRFGVALASLTILSVRLENS